MSDQPGKIKFNRAKPEPQKEAPARDKDNAAPKPPPPTWAKKPLPGLAPMGTSGARQDTRRQNEPEPQKQRFTLGEKGGLKKTFTPIAKSTREKGPSHDL